MDREKARQAGKWLYIGITGFLLAAYLGTEAIGYEIHTTFLWILRCLSVPLAIYYGRLWKNRGFWLLGSYFLLFTIRAAFAGEWELMRQEGWISELSGLWVFTACYGVGLTLNRDQLRRFGGIIATIWTAGTTAFSVIGIYSAWTDQQIYVLSKWYFQLMNRPLETIGFAYCGTYGFRLMIMTYSTISGVILSISILIAICAACGCRRKSTGCLFLLATLPQVLALALTDSRTAMISTSAGLGIMVLVCILRTAMARGGPRRRWWVWLAGCLGMAAAFAAAMMLMMCITPEFNRIKLQGVIPVAAAENEGNLELISRGFNLTESMFSGRVEIWRAALQFLRENPIILLTGTSKLGTMYGINAIVGLPYGHCHNMPLEILVESGIPGLALIIAFLWGMGRKAFRLIRTETAPAWLRLLPAVMICLWIADLDECFVWLRHGIYPMLAFQFVIYGIIAGQKETFDTP